MIEYQPDLPNFIGVEVDAYADLYSAFKLRQRLLLQRNIAKIEVNLAEYVKKRHVTSTDTVVFTKVLADAKFIPAHKSRYVSGFDLNAVEYFVVHRPGYDAKSATLENIILTFLMEEQNKMAAMGGYAPSTHFAIGQRGELIQFVDLADRTLHVRGQVDGKEYNSISIGVELEGAVGAPISLECYQTLAKLLLRLRLLCPNLKLDRKHILEHRELDPRRKKDVGTPFDYAILEKYITQFTPVITDAVLTAYTEEDVLSQIMSDVTALAEYGNALVGMAKEEQRRWRVKIEAETNKIAAQTVTRDQLTASAVTNLQTQQETLIRNFSQQTTIPTRPVKALSITNGIGVVV